MGSGELFLAVVHSFSDMWGVWLMAFVMLQAWLALYALEQKKVMACGIKEIDDYDIEIFEQYFKALLRHAGFRVEKTIPAEPDVIDLIISKGEKQVMLRLKKSGKRVHQHIVRKALLAGEHYNCAKVILATNRSYTRKAAALASSNRILLWNRHNITNALLQMREKRPAVLVPLPRRKLAPATSPQARPARTYPVPRVMIRTYTTVLQMVSSFAELPFGRFLRPG